MQLVPDAMRDATWRAVVWGGAATLLALPWVAMRFTREVQWTGIDFAVFGAMLLAACGLYEAAIRMSGDWRYRVAAAIALAIGFLTVWINLAVGMIGDEGNADNLVFAGVLLVALAGALLARFRAAGMARAMAATAVAQLAAGLVAILRGAPEALVVSLVFAAGWWLAARLFRSVALYAPAASP